MIVIMGVHCSIMILQVVISMLRWEYYLYSTYQGTTYTPQLEIGSGTNNYIKVSGGLLYPELTMALTLGSNGTRFKTIRVTDVWTQ